MPLIGDERRYVIEIAGSDLRAYLYNFGIDKSQLRPQHESWLTRNITDSVIKRVPPEKYWEIWLSGTTSRTGSFDHNLQLSRHRTDAVDRFIRGRIDAAIPLKVMPLWMGEIPAMAAGKPEISEHPLDRAVQIVVRLAISRVPTPPPAPVQRTDYSSQVRYPCCLAKLYINYLKAVARGWAMSATHGFRDTNDFELSGGYPIVRPEKFHIISNLQIAGYSFQQAQELYEKGPFMTAKPEDAVGMSQKIIGGHGPLKEYEWLLKNCDPDDPDGLCARSELRRK